MRRVLARSFGAVLALAATLLPWFSAQAAAHPLGNFTVNRYARIEPAGDGLHVLYVLDMAEVPAFQELAGLPRGSDGTIADADAAAYATRKAEAVRAHLSLTVNGAATPLDTVDRRISFPEGQGGLPTLRLEVLYSVPVRAGRVDARFRDENEPERIGWREIVVRGGEGAVLDASTVPAQDSSDELRRCPETMLTSPLDLREASFSYTVTGAASSGRMLPAQPVPVERAYDAFAALLVAEHSSPGALLLALLAAAVLGMLHALSPGHGKTVVAAYLVGSRGTVRHALALGGIVTATHTAGVYALGLVTLLGSAFILPERLYPWLSAVSGVLVAAVGGALLAGRGRAWLEQRRAGAAHRHAHALGHAHHHGESHLHHHGHDHAVPSGRVTWRALLALGVSGGLLPCPSALVVMLSAAALGQAALGLGLIVAFSAGLAATLIIIGLAMVLAGQGLARAGKRLRFPAPVAALAPAAPAVSAAAVLVVGLALAAGSLSHL